MPRRVLVLLPISLALLCLGAALAWPRVAPPVEAQSSTPFTLLAVEYWRGFLYAVDPASGALGPLARVPAPPESVGFIALVPGTRRILMTSQPHSPSDPSRLWQVDLDSPNRPLTAVLSGLRGASGIAVRPDGAVAVVGEFRDGLYEDDFPMVEYNLGTGQTRQLARLLSQPWNALFTPNGRLFVTVGSGEHCQLLELDPTTGAQRNQWVLACDRQFGYPSALAYDPATGDLLLGDGAHYLSRFNPQTDSQPHVWMTWPDTWNGAPWAVVAAPDGTLYSVSSGGANGQTKGILRILPDKSTTWLVPPGGDEAGGNLGDWSGFLLLPGPQPSTLSPMVTYTPTVAPPTLTPPSATNTPIPTATARPGQVDIEVTPSPQQVGYFSSVHGANLGASTVFAGVLSGTDLYYGVVQFDLPALPSDAKLVGVSLRLMGKTDAFLNRGQSAFWWVAMLEPRYDSLLPSMTYADVHLANFDASLPPDLHPYDLAVNGVNTFTFRDVNLDWAAASAHPSGKITFRVNGPADMSAPDNLFGWYSGTGAGDGAKGPRLHISYTTPVTATMTPTATETDMATTTATPTLTPTPSPTQALATVSATPTTTQPATPTPSPTGSPTLTVTLSPSSTATAASPTPTATPSATATQVTRTPTPTPTATVAVPSVTFDKPYYVGTDDLARVRVFDPTVTQAPIYARASSSGAFGSVVLTLWPSPTTPGLFVSDEALSFCLPDACGSSGTNPTPHLRVLSPATDLTVQYPATNPKTTGQAQWLETAPPTATVTATLTPSPSPTWEASRTATPTATLTPSPSPTQTEGSQTPTPTLTLAPSPSPSATLTPSPSPTRGEGSWTPTATPTPTTTATATSTPTATGSTPAPPYRLYLPLLSR